jgi:methyl-accepting chemotaxis protein
MDAVQFKNAVQQMQGFTPEMIQDICDMADAMSDTQRDEYAGKFAQMNKELLEKGKKATDLSQQVVSAVQQVDRKAKQIDREASDASSSQSSLRKVEEEMGNL